MTLKDAASRALRRTTGYSLTRETPEQRAQALQDASDRARKSANRHHAELAERRRAEQAEKAAQAKREHAELVAAGGDLPAYYDDELRRTIVRVRPRTMTAAPKLEALVEATRYVARNRIPGDIVECGVWRGGSMQAVALTLAGLGETERELHLFDTFEGMPPPTENDTRTRDGKTADALLAVAKPESRMWAIADLDDVRAGMDETGYPADKIHYHPGLVEDTTPGEAPSTIALLRLDTDWYSSTLHELEHLYSRLSPGGILLLDDYGDWDGARRATEEWLEKTGEPLYLAPMATGRVAVKPFGTASS